VTTKVPAALLDQDALALTSEINRVINGNFWINQRGVSGTVSLSAGAYGHDRWKAGASGCTYTFATSGGSVVLTITAGSLIQVIEGVNVPTGNVVLTWSGTAQGKIGAGSYGATGITGTGTAGTNLNVEFGTGTLTDVQLKAGTTVTPFVMRSVALETALCMRYFEKSGVGAVGSAWSANNGEAVGGSHPTANFRYFVPFRVIKRAAPTFQTYDRTGASAKCSYYVAAWTDAGTFPVLSPIASGAYVGHNIASSVETQFAWTADAEL
jgi:hypothetical protein